jgi:Ctr copper transporter family
MGGHTDSSMMMGMRMTFSSLTDYQGLVILFDWWRINTLTEFIVSCLVLSLLAVFNSWIKLRGILIDRSRPTRAPHPNHLKTSPPSPSSYGYNIDNSSSEDTVFIRRSSYSRLMVSVIVGVNYLLSLLLMLAAMTFQPLIILSIVIGTTPHYYYY